MPDKLTTAAEEIERLRKSQLEFVRAADDLLRRYNLYDMPEDDSRAWQQLADACLRSGCL
jgi:hypothetical protein